MSNRELNTSDLLIQTAKHLFFQQGYRKTTIQDICNSCNCTLGTFTYHFQKKEDLLTPIYISFIRECRVYVERHTTPTDSIKHHIMISMLYYNAIYRDEKSLSFHKEIIDIDSMSKIFMHIQTTLPSIIDRTQLEQSTDSYETMLVADHAVRTKLNTQFLAEGDFSLPAIRGLLGNIYTVTAKLFDLDQEKCLRDIEEAYEFVQSHQDHGLHLLP